METVARNASQAFAQHKLKRASDLTARSLAISELQEQLSLVEAPLRIECFDISHNQGTDVVASMVVFEDGLARKSEYRRFAMRESGGDTDWIAETIRRRFARYLESQAAPLGVAGEEVDGTAVSAVSRRFAYPPNLVVVDGGQPQANAAQAVLDDLGISDVAIVGLAKRLEEVWVPGEEYPLILPRTSEALYLLQRVRDEAHRFAITYHRQKRSKSMVVSALDGVPGLGAQRRKALMTQFGSLARLRRADIDEIMAVPGIGRATAEAIRTAVRGDDRQPEPAINTATGEVVEPTARGTRREDDGASSVEAGATRERRQRARCGPSRDRYRGAHMSADGLDAAQVEPVAGHRSRPNDPARCTSSSSPGCPAPDAAPRPSASRTSATSSWTTCRPSSSPPWSTWAAAATAPSPRSPWSWTCAAARSPPTCAG